MSVENAIRAVLEADATLVAAATGGIYDLTEAGPLGISRTGTPDVFTTDGIILPTILVKQRAANAGLNVGDEAGQTMDVRQVCEIWYYHDSSFAEIEGLRNRVYGLLHAKRVSGAGRVDWSGTIRPLRDPELDAWVERDDYLVIYIRSGS